VVSCFAPHGLKNAAQDRVGLLTLGISEPFFTGAVMSEQLVLGRRDGRPIDKWVVRPHDATAQRLGAAGVGKP
jgi:hypothetical protein